MGRRRGGGTPDDRPRRAAGNRVLEARVLPALATSALYGPRPVPEAIAVCEELLEQTRTDRKGEAVTMRALAHLEAMRGNFERARELYRHSRSSLEELGWKLHAASTSLSSGPIELLAGDHWQRSGSCAGTTRPWITWATATTVRRWPVSSPRRCSIRADTTRPSSSPRSSKELAAPDDVSSQFLWRTVRAKVMAAEGQSSRAEALAREAVDMIRTSEEPDAQAEALLGLAEILVLAGRPDEADSIARESLDLFTAKGNIVAAERAKAFLAEIAQVVLPTSGS